MLSKICSADILNADWTICRGEEMNRFKRIKLTRAQKTIRNTAIAIVLLAVLPLLFDMHFSPDKAAHEALEKAGCEDTEYIAQYTVKRGNNDKGSASVEKDMLSEYAYRQEENSRRTTCCFIVRQSHRLSAKRQN